MPHRGGPSSPSGQEAAGLISRVLALFGHHHRHSPELRSPPTRAEVRLMSRTQPRMPRGRLFATVGALAGAASVLLLVLAGCSGKTDGTAKAQSASIQPVVPIPFKIGIMVGTVSQGEDEFRAGQMVVAKYGQDHVKMVTYPDNFMQEQETVISQLVGLSSDPEVKVIVVGQAVPGTVAAVRKIREKRPDILIGMIEAHEDPDIVNATADISIQPDQLARGRTIVDVAH